MSTKVDPHGDLGTRLSTAIAAGIDDSDIPSGVNPAGSFCTAGVIHLDGVHKNADVPVAPELARNAPSRSGKFSRPLIY